MPALPNKRLSSAAGTQNTFQTEEFTDTGQRTHIKLGHVQQSGERQEERRQEGKTWCTSEPGMALNLESTLSLPSPVTLNKSINW